MRGARAEAGWARAGGGKVVGRLRASNDRSASELVDTVLAMDNFAHFKSMMLRLKADLDGSGLPQDTLDRFASAVMR